MSVLNLSFEMLESGSSKVCNIPVSADYMFFGSGEFGGGTLSLECSPDNGVTWFTVDQMLAAGRLIRYLTSGEKVRVTLTNAIVPNLKAGLRQ